MGSRVKGWLLIACAFILAGVLLYGGLFLKAGRSFSSAFGMRPDTVTEQVRQPFRDIEVRGSTEDVEFRPSEDGKCRVVFREHENGKHTASVKDGTLVIERSGGRKWYERFTLFSFGTESITVFLPEREYGALLVKESTGDVTISEAFSFESVDVALSTGDAVCRASAAGLLRIGTGTGSIWVSNVTAGTVDLSVSTGRTIAENISCGAFVSDGGTGSITLENVVAAGNMTIERGTGDVRLALCDAAEISIRTSTGDVTGTLRTGKTVAVKSGTGRIRVPEGGSGGPCRITTSTGDVEISVP